MHCKERRKVIFFSQRKEGQCARPDHLPLHKLHGKEVSTSRIWVAYVWLSPCIVVYAVYGRYWRCSSFEWTLERAITKIRQQRTRTDLLRGCRVECTSFEHQASQCSSTAINEQEKPERKRSLCLKREERTVSDRCWPPKLSPRSQRTRSCSTDLPHDAGRASPRSREATKRWRKFRWLWRFTWTGGQCSVLIIIIVIIEDIF